LLRLAGRELGYADETVSDQARQILRGRRVQLRPATVKDATGLFELMDDPSVTQWWPRTTEERIRQELFDDVVSYVIELKDEPIGLIQFAEESEPDYRHASVDIWIGAGFQDDGLGPEAIHVLAAYLFKERGHHRITIDPAFINKRAIAAYEKVGFRRVGIMRQYERGPDGEWRDGLLLDLLRSDFDFGGGGETP
jgi:aminoglycoside 6'-N-acetyltransferase